MHGPRMDNGEYFMRAYREAFRQQQQIINQYNPQQAPAYYPYDPPMAGMPEPEDTTGLKLLEEFLAKRRKDYGDERK